VKKKKDQIGKKEGVYLGAEEEEGTSVIAASSSSTPWKSRQVEGGLYWKSWESDVNFKGGGVKTWGDEKKQDTQQFEKVRGKTAHGT